MTVVRRMFTFRTTAIPATIAATERGSVMDEAQAPEEQPKRERRRGERRLGGPRLAPAPRGRPGQPPGPRASRLLARARVGHDRPALQRAARLGAGPLCLRA